MSSKTIPAREVRTPNAASTEMDRPSGPTDLLPTRNRPSFLELLEFEGAAKRPEPIGELSSRHLSPSRSSKSKAKQTFRHWSSSATWPTISPTSGGEAVRSNAIRFRPQIVPQGVPVCKPRGFCGAWWPCTETREIPSGGINPCKAPSSGGLCHCLGAPIRPSIRAAKSRSWA